MTKTLARDEKGELQRTREQLVDDIIEAQIKLSTSMEQVRRHHYHKLGELFIQLRMTFKADIEFGKFCADKFPAIKPPQRHEYMAYRKKLGEVASAAATGRHFPPLRQTTYPNRDHRDERQSTYTRIVDDEVDEDRKRFEMPPTEREKENEIVLDLAEKIVSAGFRVLAVKLHPDKGNGDKRAANEAMRRLNAAKALLLDALTRAELRM
jgi:hypothetical protein